MTNKIDYRGPVIWNIILYLFFSLLFIFLQELFKNSGTIVQKNYLKVFLVNHISIVGVFFVTGLFFLSYKKKLAIGGFVLSTLITIVLTMYNLNINFSKFILIILFSYIILAFYLLQFYSSEVTESYYNPFFDEKNLFNPMLKQIKVELVQSDEKVYEGYLTNWSEEGCYIYLHEDKKVRGAVELKITFQDTEFTTKGRVVSHQKNGIGIKLKNSANEETLNTLGWFEFYEIIEEMGYNPELLV